MKSLFFAVCFAAFLTVLAATTMAQRCDVPARRGTVYIVVKYARYNSRDTLKGGTKTRVRIQWGPNRFDRKFPSFSLTATAGVVIAASHNANDSVPLFIDTNGSLQRCEQLDRPPSYPTYERATW